MSCRGSCSKKNVTCVCSTFNAQSLAPTNSKGRGRGKGNGYQKTCTLAKCEPNPPNWPLLNKVNKFDESTLNRYIPDRPDLPNPPFKDQYIDGETYQWPVTQITIPSEPGVGSFPGASPTINAAVDGYSKFLSISFYIFMYGGINAFTVQQTDPGYPLFVIDKDKRGPNNLRKKQYMFALRACTMPKYQARINAFLNACYTDFTSHELPILSSYQDNLVDFFMGIHLGDGEHPEYVKEYFHTFLKILSDPVESTRNVNVMYGWQNSKCVREYIASRVPIAIQDDTTFIYYWHLAGMNPLSIVGEALHNIIAFNQYTNTLELVVKAQLGSQLKFFDIFQFPGPYPPPMNASSWKLATVEEMYRILSPNNLDFSRLNQDTPDVPAASGAVQARHVRQVLMIQAWGGLVQYGTPNPAGNYRIAETGTADYIFDFNTVRPCPPLAPTNLSNIDVASQFFTDTADGETVVDANYPLLQPVFSTTKYTSFGLGYRRCAGEIFNYYLTILMMESFKDIDWSIGGLSPGQPDVVPLAPFKFSPNTIYGVNPPPYAP